MPQLKILHILDNLGVGGAEVWLIALLRRWQAEGHAAPEIHILATGGMPGFLDEEARALGARVIYLRYGWRRMGHFTRAFRRLLRAENYDAIHDHADYASGRHFLLGAGLLPPVRVAHFHNYKDGQLRPARRRLADWAGKKLIAVFASHAAAASHQALREHGLEENRFRHISRAVLYCGLDAKDFEAPRAVLRAQIRDELGWPAEVRIILCVGRIDPSPDSKDSRIQKNTAFALAIILECARRDPSIRAIFAGPPSPATPALEQRAAQAGHAAHVHFAGVRRDIPGLMLAADVLLFPSQGEGLGMAAVEAQAAGLPVLASENVPRECMVVPELMRFMPLKAGVKEWATGVAELMNRRSPENANRAVAQSVFSIAASGDTLLRLYAGDGATG